jgi:hypothetical protein
VLLVGAFDAFDEETAKASGATANIKKPFEPHALVDLVMSILPSRSDDISDAYDDNHAEPTKAAAPAAPPSAVAPAAPAPPVAAPAPVASAPPVTPAPHAQEPPPEPNADDLLGLENIFKEEPAPGVAGTMTDEEIDRIADRVIQRLSSQVIESIAWDIVPDITEKIVREELKRIDES